MTIYALPGLHLLTLMSPLLIAGLAALALRHASRQTRIEKRLQDVRFGRQERHAASGNVAGRMLDGVSRFGHIVASSGLLSGKALHGIRVQLVSAGLRHDNAVGFFLGAKIILAISLPVIATAAMPSLMASGGKMRLLLVGVAVLGLLLPEWLLRWRKKRYHAALERALPDMLDMLVMCTESGLSLEPALSRVGNEVTVIHPMMGAELTLTSIELHIMSDARIAFTNLGERSGLVGLRRLASTLIQTLQYGTPLGPSLRGLANEMRLEMLTRFEERAGRLPALLTVVMILFILPSLFMVVGGPAIVQVVKQFGG